MKKKILAVILLLLSFIPIIQANAADMLIPNYSFESNLTSWTQNFGTGGITASTAQQHSGAKSIKITDTLNTGQFGIQSAFMSATAGTTYETYAWAYITSGAADLYLRYYDSSHTLITSTYVSKSSPTNQWTYLKARMTAPAGTAYLAVLLYSNNANVGTAYWDDVTVTAEFTTLGPQVTSASIHAATFGKDSANNDMIYAVVDGALDGTTQARLVAINANTLAVANSFTLPGSSGGWAATTATDGKVYVGAYTNGHLYQYTPGAASVIDLGQALAGETFIYGLTPGLSGKVYAGTFPNARLFKYTPGTGFAGIGPTPFSPGSVYSRAVAYDAANDITYVGTGTNARLMRFDNKTGTNVNILPAAYSSESLIYGLNVSGTKVFAHMSPSTSVVVMNVTSGGVATLDAVIPSMTSTYVSPADNGLVYYTKDTTLYSYNMASKVSTSLSSGFGVNPYAFGILTLTDQVNYPGKSVVGIGNCNGILCVSKYDIQTGYTAYAPLSVSESVSGIESILGGADGKIYSSGYLTGGTGIYTPLRSDLNTPTLRGVEQAEGMTTLNGKNYFGGYPGAIIYEHDPNSAWVSGTNPRQMFSLEANQQDRPFGMASGGGLLFIGTAPEYGILGGALTIYNPATSQYTVHQNIVNKQSIIALTYLNGYVYGGSSVSGGLGIAPSQTEAKLLKYKVSDGTSTVISLPVSGLKAITAVTVGPDGNIWMMAEGYLFLYNPTTNAFVYYYNWFPTVSYNPTATATMVRDATLISAKDGNVYGTISGLKLFRIVPSTMSMTVLDSGGAIGLSPDWFGNLYYFTGSTLKRYAF
ncbi:carbohydrate binding domain-containing protein [Paenibacillus nasutitermitis]|uniref:CBM-cenC domain-containing protein n=1 Tax=Paenibacillus nasutitermitis TaxID=1652958 RepID=A0A916YNX4_9BACL|nr:carbohydrate binding domain-containing protein [Paenibacillus nasutitermitis]GGD52280.1 hypothetical protein GCM10010911_07230 [Paenibacillus nasutitermitis]